MTIEKLKIKNGELDLPPNHVIEDLYWGAYRLFSKAYWYVYTNLYANHKSIRNAVPKTWTDLDGITENVLSAIIISFVEEEKGLDQIKMMESSLGKDDEYLKKEWGSVDAFWDYYKARYSDYKRLEEIYKWIKTDKKKMQNYLESLDLDTTGVVHEYIRVENSIYDKDSEMLADLVKLRKYLWT
jgi:hypothetical protein